MAQPSCTGAAEERLKIQAKTMPPDCLQPGTRFMTFGKAKEVRGGSVTSGSDDCLFLNVWAPKAAAPKGGRPVVFYIPGVNFESGGLASEGSTKARNFIELYGDVVVVSANHRLSLLGFLGSDALRHNSFSSDTGNYGVEDVRLALLWVQRKIVSFGGDPKRVIVSGTGCSGALISGMLVSAAFRGLFSRSIMQSGGFAKLASKSMAQAQDRYNSLLKGTDCVRQVSSLGANDPTEQTLRTDEVMRHELDCLEKLSGEQLIMAAYTMPVNRSWFESPWAPVQDGVMLPKESPMAALEAGALQGYMAEGSLILGFDLSDGAQFTSISPDEPAHMLSYNMSVADLDHWLQSNFHLSWGQVAETYPTSLDYPVNQNVSREWQIAQHILGDTMFSCPALRAAELNAYWGGAQYLYEFGQPAGPVEPALAGLPGHMATMHDQLQYTWATVPEAWGDAALGLSFTMASQWNSFYSGGTPCRHRKPISAFAHSQNPVQMRYQQAMRTQAKYDREEYCEWPTYDLVKRRSIHYGPAGKASLIRMHMMRRCEFWKGYFKDRGLKGYDLHVYAPSPPEVYKGCHNKDGCSSAWLLGLAMAGLLLLFGSLYILCFADHCKSFRSCIRNCYSGRSADDDSARDAKELDELPVERAVDGLYQSLKRSGQAGIDPQHQSFSDDPGLMLGRYTYSG